MTRRAFAVLAALAATAGDAGADLFAARDVEIPPGERALVPTGIAIALAGTVAIAMLPRRTVLPPTGHA